MLQCNRYMNQQLHMICVGQPDMLTTWQQDKLPITSKDTEHKPLEDDYNMNTTQNHQSLATALHWEVVSIDFSYNNILPFSFICVLLLMAIYMIWLPLVYCSITTYHHWEEEQEEQEEEEQAMLLAAVFSCSLTKSISNHYCSQSNVHFNIEIVFVPGISSCYVCMMIEHFSIFLLIMGLIDQWF